MHESRGRREENKPWGEVIKEDMAMSRPEAQKQKQTEALLEKRDTGMKKACMSKR